MNFLLGGLLYLKKKSILIIKDNNGSFIIHFILWFTILLTLILFGLQIGIGRIEQTQIQTATDAASLAGISTIQVNPVSEKVEIVEDQQGDVTEVNVTIDNWEIDADGNKANDEAKNTYLFNTNKYLDDDEFKSTLNPEGIVYTNDAGADSLFYEYNVKVTDKRKPFILWNPFFGDDKEIEYSMESTSKTRIIIP